MFYFFIGIICFQVIYIYSQWNKYRTSDYLYYGLYLVSVLIYFIMIFEQVGRYNAGVSLSPWIRFFKEPVVLFVFFCYVLFAQYFIEVFRHSPSLNKVLKWTKRITVVMILLHMILF